MRQAGLWMGIFWIGIGIFILVSEWMGRASFPIPKVNISLGWLVIVLGIWRIWWWWSSVEKPRRRRLAIEAEQRQLELEMERELTEKEK